MLQIAIKPQILVISIKNSLQAIVNNSVASQHNFLSHLLLKSKLNEQKMYTVLLTEALYNCILIRNHLCCSVKIRTVQDKLGHANPLLLVKQPTGVAIKRSSLMCWYEAGVIYDDSNRSHCNVVVVTFSMFVLLCYFMCVQSTHQGK